MTPREADRLRRQIAAMKHDLARWEDMRDTLVRIGGPAPDAPGDKHLAKGIEAKRRELHAARQLLSEGKRMGL